jgi:hypothetical protein
MQTKSELREYARRLHSLYERAFRRWERRMDAAGVYSDVAFEALQLMNRIDRRLHVTKLMLAALEELGPYYE